MLRLDIIIAELNRKPEQMKDFNDSFARSRFADPTVDFAFKRVFGTDRYKAATIGLLNSLITERTIVDVHFLNTEVIGETADSRKACIDVLCEDQDGTRFIVEMQKARQTNFRQRTLFYSSRLISMAGERGRDWDYSLPDTYVVSFLKFGMRSLGLDAEIPEDAYILRYSLKEERSGTRMPGSTEFIFLGIEDFNKKDRELVGYPEKWLYLLGRTGFLEEIPSECDGDAVFSAYFEACERAGFSKDDETTYVKDMMTDLDILNARRLAVKEGREEGRAEGRAEGREEGREEGHQEGFQQGRLEERNGIALRMLALGLEENLIAKSTGLSVEQIRILQK